eukprot:TRINITY_DN2472_c0_g1_i3.p1 TRINITY_DN2472_c0_g1~~TRINITY_DN2472_c0_g1_i3.p1  ORF type:complete len:144 (-),score=8.73 TRINITY_DN2472_c0_g1_i3:74-505(-)
MYIIHAVFCGSLYYLGTFPFQQYILLFYLCVFEQSTPWLHFRGYLHFCGWSSGVVYWTIGIIFVVSFVICRIILGTWMSVLWWYSLLDLYQSGTIHSMVVMYWYMISDFVLIGLMYYWLWIIITSGDAAEDGLITEETERKKK